MELEKTRSIIQSPNYVHGETADRKFWAEARLVVPDNKVVIRYTAHEKFLWDWTKYRTDYHVRIAYVVAVSGVRQMSSFYESVRDNEEGFWTGERESGLDDYCFAAVPGELISYGFYIYTRGIQEEGLLKIFITDLVN